MNYSFDMRAFQPVCPAFFVPFIPLAIHFVARPENKCRKVWPQVSRVNPQKAKIKKRHNAFPAR